MLLGKGDLAERLVEAGLDSAQISLESHDSEIHDKVVGIKGAHKNTVAGFQKDEIHGYSHSHQHDNLQG